VPLEGTEVRMAMVGPFSGLIVVEVDSPATWYSENSSAGTYVERGVSAFPVIKPGNGKKIT
jgi:hypothetical protein